MSLAPITLVTDKSTAVIDNAHRRLRQDENGLSITVAVLNEDNTAYDLTGKNLVFCENKQNNKIIVDNGKGDNSGKFNRNSDNDTKGIFTYVLQEDVYAASGKAWFEITNGTTVDSTKNFYFDVEKDADISISNNDYIGSLKALETAMAGAQSKITSDLTNMEAQITQKIATLQSQWNSELQSIKNKANTDTDAAVKAINDRYTSDFTKLKSDFVSWQTSTIQNYQKQVDAILAKMLNNGTEVTNVQKQVNDTIARMQTLTQQFSKIDFTKFIKPSDLNNYYTKSEIDPMIAPANWKEVDSPTNLDTITYTSKLFLTNVSDSPDNKWGFLITGKGTYNRMTQEWWSDGNGIGLAAPHYYRQTSWNMKWGPWVKQATQNDVDSLTNAITKKANSADVYTRSELNPMIEQAGKLKTINGKVPDRNGDIQVPAYAPNLLIGTSHTPITKLLTDWGGDFYYYLSESIPKGTKISIRAYINNQTNEPIYMDGKLDNAHSWLSSGTKSIVNTAPHSTGYTYNTYILSKDMDKNTGYIYTSFTSQISDSKSVTVSDVKLAVWPDLHTPPDMTWLPNEADKADKSDVTTLQGRITALENEKPIKASSQDDAVAKSKSNNGEYYW